MASWPRWRRWYEDRRAAELLGAKDYQDQVGLPGGDYRTQYIAMVNRKYDDIINSQRFQFRSKIESLKDRAGVAKDRAIWARRGLLYVSHRDVQGDADRLMRDHREIVGEAYAQNRVAFQPPTPTTPLVGMG